MKTLIVSILLVASSFTSNATATNDDNVASTFAYNSEMKGNKIVSETVYKVEKQKFLHQHLKYNYIYDAKGRIAEKEVLKWNQLMENYEKQYCLRFSYNHEQIAVELIGWNAKQQTYSIIKEKTVYQISDTDTTVNYMSYKWNEKENNWNLVMKHITSTQNENLLAKK